MASKNQDDQFFNALRRKLNGDDEEKKTKETNDERFFTALRQKLPASGTPVKAEAPAPQPTAKQDTSTQTGRLRPGWSVEDVVEATEPKSLYQKALDKIDQAKDKAEAARRFGNMSTEDLLSYVPTSTDDKRLYETYMGSRLEAAKSLERQSKQAKNDAAKAGNEAEAYREFLGMPGASNEEIFGLAQAVRENNAQAKSLEPQKWLEYAEGLKESEGKKQSLTEQGRELKRRADAASEQGQAWEYSNVIKSYGELINSPDFAKKSQYAAPKESADDIWKKDKNDPRLRYMAINGDSHAQVGLQQEAWSTGDRGGVGSIFDLGGDNDYLFELTDTEKGIYNALYASSPEAADNFVEKLKPYLEVRARDTYAKRMAQIARESPVGASIASVATNLAQSGEYVLQLAELIGKGKINQNSAAYRASQMSNAVRGEVSKMVEEKWGKAGSFAYNTGMSMADFLTTTAVGGGTKALSLALMGTRAASNTVLNLKDRGLDDTAAFTLGSIAGAAEIVTESFSLERLLNPNLVADGIAKNIFKNVLAEASEEGASNLINLAAERIYDAITGNNEAEWKQKVYDAIQKGADPNNAVLAAIQDNLVQIGMDMLSGGISGGLMSAAGTPFYLNNFNNSQQGQYANAIRGNEEELQALIRRGLESPQNTESYQLAQAALKQFADGKTPSALTIARLAEANQQQVESETAEQSGQGRLRLTLPRTTPQNAPPVPEQGLKLPTAEEKAPVQESKLRLNGTEKNAENREGADEDAQIVEATVRALREEANAQPAPVQAETQAQTTTINAETPPVPQETRITPGLTLPTRTTQSTERAAETPRQTLPTAEQISAFGGEQNTAERAARVESELVTRLRASKPGLLMDDYASKIDENERRAIDETAKRLGLRVGFSDTVSVGQDNAKIYDDGVVLIEKNNPNPIGFLYGHEMGHWLQQNSPEAYNEFAEAARATDPEWFKTREEATTAAYRDAGIEISPERIQEEVLSDYAGWLVQDEDVLNRFIEQNKEKPNVLRRLYEAIKALAAKLTGREKQQATTAADLLLRAMNATEANVQKDVTQAGETRSLLKSPNDNVYNGDNGGEDNGELYEGTGSGSVQNGWSTGGSDRGSVARSPQNQSRGSGESWDTLSQSKQRAIGDTAERYLNSLDSDTQSILGRTGNPYTIVKTIWDRYQENPASADLWVGFIPDVYDLLNEVSDIVSSPEGNETISSTADSDGNELSAGQTSYFADSKIRDKQGRLLVLYHGTTAVFTTFDLSRSGQNYNGWSEFGEGIYLTPNAKLAQFYADEAGRGRRTRVIPYYVNLTNPFSTMDAVPFAIDDLAEKYNLTEADQRSLLGAGYRLLDFLNEHHESVRDYLVAHEYDGVWDSYNGSKPNQVVAYYQNQIKDISNVNPTDDPDTMHSIKGLDADTAPESIQRNDEDYTAALDDGDIAKATQLVHETADSSMPDSKVRNASTGELRYVYHYTNKNFYEFRPMGQSAGSNRTLGDGYYVSTSETEFKSFGKNKMTLFANITNPFEMELTEEQAQAVYDKYFRPYHEDRFHTYEPHVVGKLQSYSQVFDYLKEAAEKNGTTTSAILSELGFDGVHDGPEWVAFYPEQLKSADVATYNDDGQLIPLSERFNPEEKDTRYSLKGLNADIAPESIQKYGQIPKGEKPARDINVPRKVTDKKNERVSWTARTALEAKATPDAAIPGIAELVEKGAFSYNVQTDKAAIENAEATIKDKGWSAALADWTKDVTKGNVSKSNTAMGWALYNNAANAGDLDTALTVLDLMVQHQRNAAQALQASRILKQLSPEAQLYGVQRSVDNLVKELQERYGKRKNIDIQINRDLAQAFLDAKTEEERQKALKALYKDIGRQVPATFRDKWNAWRYLAMLGNLRTHIRNISGNLGFAPVVFAKDQVATVLEGVASAVSNGKVERTKGLVLPVRDHDLVKAAWDRYQSVRDEALGGGKYNDSQMANKWIEEGRTIFKFKPLELARRGNSAALDAEDAWFSQPHYTYALAQYCKANGIAPAQIRSGEGMGEADDYAIKEARKATYRDINAFSDFVSSIGRTADRKTGVGKAASAVLEGVLPFRRTPANILVRGLEYSPVGLLKSLTYDLAQVMTKDADGNPRMSVAEMLDDVSEGLTGTGIVLLGGLLAKLGLLRGHGEDEKKERDYYDLMGFQNYALTLPNGESYTLDWLAPESLPLFVGVNIYEKLQQSKGDMNMSDLIDVVSQISEPMLEMSMLQSLNDMFESIGYAKENELSGLTQILSSAATSYLTQAIPTLLGQGERTGENLRMTTYTDKNKWLTKSMQYTLGKISAKVPGWDYGQVPYIDAWGRTEETGEGWVDRAFKNMVNPAYTDKTRMSDMEKELLRLYELNPEDNGSVLATSHKASKYITHNKERIDLTAEQYVDYATTKGQTAYSLMTDLVKTEEYKNASDEDKIKMVDSVYDYAATIAKGELLESLGNTYDDYEKLKTKLDKGADILDMIALTQEIKAADEAGNANKSYDTLEKLTAVEALGLPEAKAEPLLEQQLSEGQWEKYSTLKDADVNYDTRLDIMRKYAELDSNDEMKPGEKALEFSHYVDSLNLTSKQTQLVKDTYKFWSMVPAEAKRYETFKQAGLSEDKSKHTAEVLSALKPLPGKEDVTDLQRYRAIESDKTLTNAEKIKVIGSIMGTEMKTETGNPSQWAKFNTALNNGQTLSQAIDLCENGRLDEFEKWTKSAAKGENVKWDVYDTFLKETAKLNGKDDNGKSVNGLLKKRVVAYIDSLNLTPDQKDALLTDYNSTYKHDVTWHNGSYGSSGSGKTYARANLSRLELPRTNTTRQTGRLTLSRR